MRGYVREYRPGKWSFTCYVGKTADGKPKKMEKGGFTSKKECDAALNKKLVELAETGKVFIPSKKTIDEVFKEYMDVQRFIWTASTYTAKLRLYETHIKEPLGHRFVKSIKTADLDNLVISKMEKYKPQSVLNIRKVINGIIRFALQREYIKINPIKGAVILKTNQRKNIEIFTADEIRQIIDLMKNTNYFPFIMIGIYTGMRAGEITGLRWQDIDLEHGTISIERQMLNELHRIVLTHCKYNSERLIHIPTVLIDYLAQLKHQQEEYRELAGDKYTASIQVYNYIISSFEDVSDFVVVKKNGHPMHRNSYDYIAEKCAKYGISFHPHKMRHTYATSLLEAGCTPKMLQESLGHKSALSSLNIYSHVTSGHSEDVISKLPTY